MLVQLEEAEAAVPVDVVVTDIVGGIGGKD